MPTIDIRDNTHFQKELKDAKERLVVVDFHAVWCGPCKAIAPVYSSLSEKYKSTTTFLRVDVDQCREIAQGAKVEAMPSFGFYHKGRLLELFKGADASKLEATISRLSSAHAKTAFTGAGHSMVGGSGAAAAAPAKAAAAAAGGAAAASGAKRERKNPWADAGFAENKMKAAKPGDAPKEEAKKATTAAGAPAERTLRGVAATGGMPSSAPSATAAAAAPAPASAASGGGGTATTGRAAASANDAQLKVNHSLLTQLLSFGYTQVRSEKALISTQNRNIEAALNWLLEHENDKDIDEPWTVVAAPSPPAAAAAPPAAAAAPVASPTPTTSTDAAAATPAATTEPATAPTSAPPAAAAAATSTGGDGATAAPAKAATTKASSGGSDMNFDEDAELDPAMRAILADMKKRQAEEDAAASRPKGVAAASSAAASGQPEKKKIADMTSDEKKAWVLERVELSKQKRAKEAIEREKASFKSQKEITHAAADMKEAHDRRIAETLAKQKKKDEADARKVRERTREKINAAKAERRKQAELEAAELERQKAVAAAKKA